MTQPSFDDDYLDTPLKLQDYIEIIGDDIEEAVGALKEQEVEQLVRVIKRKLAEIDASAPFDRVLVTGDVTDAGTRAEWARFLDLFRNYPELRARLLFVPGNHDVNIVDRSNPGRFDLPWSAGQSLRKLQDQGCLACPTHVGVATADYRHRRPPPPSRHAPRRHLRPADPSRQTQDIAPAPHRRGRAIARTGFDRVYGIRRVSSRNT